MKTILLIMVGAATLLVTAGCEDEHEHHGHHYGGAYDGEYHDYGHGQYQNYPGQPGPWQRSDDWHPR